MTSRNNKTDIAIEMFVMHSMFGCFDTVGAVVVNCRRFYMAKTHFRLGFAILSRDKSREEKAKESRIERYKRFLQALSACVYIYAAKLICTDKFLIL